MTSQKPAWTVPTHPIVNYIYSMTCSFSLRNALKSIITPPSLFPSPGFMTVRSFCFRFSLFFFLHSSFSLSVCFFLSLPISHLSSPPSLPSCFPSRHLSFFRFSTFISSLRSLWFICHELYFQLFHFYFSISKNEKELIYFHRFGVKLEF